MFSIATNYPLMSPFYYIRVSQHDFGWRRLVEEERHKEARYLCLVRFIYL